MAEFDMCGEPIFIDISKAPDFLTAPTVTNLNEEFLQPESTVEHATQTIAGELGPEQPPTVETSQLQNGRIRCEECQRYTAETEEKMLRHIRKVHRGENPFQCYMCDYSTYNTTLFEEHVNIHQGIKPYKCSHCPYKSASKKNTKKHEQRHRSDNPLKCKVCDFIAQNNKSLQCHVDMHGEANVKWHKCSSCKFKTKLLSKLKKHKKIHSAPCTRCKFVAPSKKLLRKHLKADHNVEIPVKKPGKRFDCEKCQWSSQCKSKILLHLIHHPDQVVDESYIDISILRKHGIMT